MPYFPFASISGLFVVFAPPFLCPVSPPLKNPSSITFYAFVPVLLPCLGNMGPGCYYSYGYVARGGLAKFHSPKGTQNSLSIIKLILTAYLSPPAVGKTNYFTLPLILLPSHI